MSRIEQTFAALKKSGRKALITFIMGGDPDVKASQHILDNLPSAGADLIEIGMPFSDPMADGPAIQAAGLRALSAGVKLKDILAMVAAFRKKNAATPIILMGYYNVIYRYGVEKFCKDAQRSGVDGVILVDLPPEEEDEFTQFGMAHGIDLIRLIAPTTDEKRFTLLAKKAGGFLYYIAVTGITGTKSADIPQLKTRVAHLKSQSPLPVAVGFGIKTPEQAAEISRFSDAVVVGSALVEKIAAAPDTVTSFVQSLRAAMDRA